MTDFASDGPTATAAGLYPAIYDALADLSDPKPRAEAIMALVQARYTALESENARLRGGSQSWLLECVTQERDAALARVAELKAELDAATAKTWQRQLFEECETTRWDPDKRNTFGEECAHLHEEVSEAFREWRVRKDAEIWYEADGKPRGVPVELADVLIGLFYNAEVLGFDLMQAVGIKHEWNLHRDYQTEGRTLHPIAEPVGSLGDMANGGGES